MTGVQSLTLGGQAVDLFVPVGPVRFITLYLHSQDQEHLFQLPGIAEILTQYGLACIAPRGGDSWWSGHHPDGEPALRNAVIPWMQAFRPESSLAVFGLGMGGQGALRLGFRMPTDFPVVLSIAAIIDYHELYGQHPAITEMYTSKEQCRQDTAPMHLHPSRHPAHLRMVVDCSLEFIQRGHDRLHEKLLALGVAHEYNDRYHESSGYEVDMQRVLTVELKWMQDKLELMSRRLV